MVLGCCVLGCVELVFWGRWELGKGDKYIGQEALFSCLIMVRYACYTALLPLRFERANEGAFMVSIAVGYRYQRTKQAKLYTRTFATRPFFAILQIPR